MYKSHVECLAGHAPAIGIPESAPRNCNNQMQIPVSVIVCPSDSPAKPVRTTGPVQCTAMILQKSFLEFSKRGIYAIPRPPPGFKHTTQKKYNVSDRFEQSVIPCFHAKFVGYFSFQFDQKKRKKKRIKRKEKHLYHQNKHVGNENLPLGDVVSLKVGNRKF
ncbi:hypothetical protein ACRALDRAFT_208166 [Sodiomyces alcalophilus JCM 7366]|uniref:uncharacterized protein n=1 Tax=Sodiomyces alcalophilus JCM 7366 TaxID=591952 RepID=UPI0039B37426